MLLKSRSLLYNMFPVKFLAMWLDRSGITQAWVCLQFKWPSVKSASGSMYTISYICKTQFMAYSIAILNSVYMASSKLWLITTKQQEKAIPILTAGSLTQRTLLYPAHMRRLWCDCKRGHPDILNISHSDFLILRSLCFVLNLPGTLGLFGPHFNIWILALTPIPIPDLICPAL